MDQTKERLGERETLSDIAHNVERWVHAVVLRTYAHETVEDMAQHTCIPVINALSDLEHPCQALADYFTLQESFGDLKKSHAGLRRRRQQCRSLADADRRDARLEDSRGDPKGLRAGRSKSSPTARDHGRGKPARSSK